jgi:hypothetical protein
MLLVTGSQTKEKVVVKQQAKKRTAQKIGVDKKRYTFEVFIISDAGLGRSSPLLTRFRNAGKECWRSSQK